MINLFTQDFPVMFIDFKNIKLLKRHRRFVVNTVSGNLLKSKKIAIVALYPRGPLWNSVARLISSLLEEGYEVVAVVNNSSLRSWIPNLSSFPITIIERENVGRDFGSYKCGVNFLYEKGLITQINSLLLCNDSVIYGSGFGNFLKSFEDQSSDWTTAFLNFEKHTHAQSFFQSFSKEILQGRTFLNFWFDYYPSNRRVHAIDRGEVRLSQQLISEGFFPKSIVNAENIRNNYPSEKLALNDFFSVMPEDFYNTLNLPIQIKNELFWHSLQRSFMEKNCSHLAGLLAFKALGAPLKLDLIATGRVSIESLREALANDGLESGEISELTSEFLATRARLI
jgi:lipopolysaccharide biosynthesis protein